MSSRINFAYERLLLMPFPNMKYLIAAAVCVALLGSCQEAPSGVAASDNFPVTSPLRVDTSYTVDYVAEITSVQNIELRSRVRGYIERVYVDEGKHVNAGQLLFTIGSQEYQEEVLKANANLKSAIADAKTAELDYENVKILVEKNIVSKSELEMAKAKVAALHAKIEEARAHEASAKLRLGFTQIRAPFPGVIDRIMYKAGSLIDEGTLLTTLSDNSEVFAYFSVSEKEYLDFVTNASDEAKFTEVSLILANNEKHPHRGRIETVEGEIDKRTGSIAFRARFPNPEKILKHGASGKVRVVRHIDSALVIPQKSTFEIQDRIYVYTVDSAHRTRLRPVIIGQRLPHLYVVEQGLSENDRFIYEGIQEARDSSVITPEFIRPQQIIHQLASVSESQRTAH